MKRLIVVIAVAAAGAALWGCERRIIVGEEMFFTKYAEKNWKKLSPKMKEEYYKMVERQKARAREERSRKKARKR